MRKGRRSKPPKVREQLWVLPSRFEFYEKVRIVTDDPRKVDANGALGCIVSRMQEAPGVWIYPVYLYETHQTCLCWESELQSTGEFDRVERLCAMAQRSA